MNAKQAVNSSSFNGETNENTLLVVDSLDVYASEDDTLSVTGYQSMNMISGYTVGNWLIGPGVLISENFDITYGLGNLTITPATLTVTAKDTVTDCSGVQPAYSSTKAYYQYDDVDTSVIQSGPDYAVYSGNTNMGTGNLPGGTYQIVPSNLVQKDPVPNYNIVYENGTLTVAALPATPVVTVENNCGSSTLSTTATGTLLWSNGATTPSITVSNAANYTVTTTVNGCTSLAGSGTSAPKAIPSTPVVTVANNCGSSTLSTNAAGSLLWSNGATTPSIIVNNAATYTVKTTVNGCASANGSGTSAPKAIPATPVVTVVNNCGSSTLSTNAAGSLLWSNGATTPSITVSNAATYTVKTTVNGCASANGSGTSAAKAVPATPVVTVVNNCNGTSTLSTTAPSGGSLLWSTGATSSSITVSNAATYTVVAKGSNGCSSLAGNGTSAPKTTPSTPVVTVVNNCGSSLLSTTAAGSLLWSNGATTSSITVSNAATYTVKTTVNGCTSANGSGTSAPKALPSAPTASVTQPTCTNTKGTITVTSFKTGLTFSITGSGYTNTNGIFTNLSPGTYNLTSKNSNGCISPATVISIVANVNCSSIGDLVFKDANANGIKDATETGISGVTVKLLNSAGTVLATTTTNGSGIYGFSSLAPGTYKVSFTTPSGYYPTTSNVGSDDTKDSDPVAGTTANYTLALNQSNTTVDAGFIPSILALGNRVWYDTNNDGINNSSENGVRSITVKLYNDADNNNVADGAAIATKTTDANGYYSFTALAPGNYIVGATIPTGYMSSSVNGSDPDNNNATDDNGTILVGTEIRGNAITLSINSEPDGSSNNTNTNNSYDFGMLPDCSCINATGNLLTNGSFESGTTGWTASGGSVSTGTGYFACGSKNGFNNASNKLSLVYQDVTISAGNSVTFYGFAGIHTAGLSCSPKLSLIFRSASGTVLSQTEVAVTRDVDVNFGQLAFYTITATAPAGHCKSEGSEFYYLQYDEDGCLLPEEKRYRQGW